MRKLTTTQRAAIATLKECSPEWCKGSTRNDTVDHVVNTRSVEAVIGLLYDERVDYGVYAAGDGWLLIADYGVAGARFRFTR